MDRRRLIIMNTKGLDLRERMVYKNIPGFNIAFIDQDEIAQAGVWSVISMIQGWKQHLRISAG